MKLKHFGSLNRELKIYDTSTLKYQEVWLASSFMALLGLLQLMSLWGFILHWGSQQQPFLSSSVLSDRVRKKTSNSHLKENIKQSQSPLFTQLFYFQLPASAEFLTDHLTEGPLGSSVIVGCRSGFMSCSVEVIVDLTTLQQRRKKIRPLTRQLLSLLSSDITAL